MEKIDIMAPGLDNAMSPSSLYWDPGEDFKNKTSIISVIITIIACNQLFNF